MGDPEKLKIISEFLEKNELKNAHETYEWSSVEVFLFFFHFVFSLVIIALLENNGIH